MILKQIGSNMTEVTRGDVTVLFSYQTPVAFRRHDGQAFRTSKKFSVTTSKHINKWLDGQSAEIVSQDAIEAHLA